MSNAETLTNLVTEKVKEANRMPSFSLGFEIRRALDVERAITQVLENTLHDLESLRAEVERLGLKDTPDVREIRAVEVLRGIDEAVDYIDLVDLVQAMKDGLARRRVTLTG